MQWLNRVVTKVWPYYDEAVCKMVKVRIVGGCAGAMLCCSFCC